MESLTPVQQLKVYLQDEINSLYDDVEEAYEDRDKLYEGERDFGHSTDSFDAGWDCGRVTGKYDKLQEVLDKVNLIFAENK